MQKEKIDLSDHRLVPTVLGNIQNIREHLQSGNEILVCWPMINRCTVITDPTLIADAGDMYVTGVNKGKGTPLGAYAHNVFFVPSGLTLINRS